MTNTNSTLQYQSGPKVGKKKVYDDNSYIVNWSAGWPKGQELETLVRAGHLDGMMPKDIKDKYPQYKKFRNKAFGQAVRSVRMKLNKEIGARIKHQASEGSYNGLEAQPSEHILDESHKKQPGNKTKKTVSDEQNDDDSK